MKADAPDKQWERGPQCQCDAMLGDGYSMEERGREGRPSPGTFAADWDPILPSRKALKIPFFLIYSPRSWK